MEVPYLKAFHFRLRPFISQWWLQMFTDLDYTTKETGGSKTTNQLVNSGRQIMKSTFISRDNLI